MMDQTRKRRLNSRKAGLSQCKVARAEEPEDLTDGTDMKGSYRRCNKIRTSSPQADSQEHHAACTQTPEDDADKTLVITLDKEQGITRPVGRRKGLRRKKEAPCEAADQEMAGKDEIQPEVEIDQDLDRELENKSRQHNLTSANVRSIIHEVITNEHVVAMMKAAINEMEPVPVFEPKMTRSKLKEVVEKGVVIPAWNISPIKKPTKMKKAPQFVDIPLDEEDSSDEEYRPDEEEEDETAEETFLESDLENSVSSPRVNQVRLQRSQSEHEHGRSSGSRLSFRRSRHLTVDVAPMGPPTPPPAPSGAPECSFLEKLHAVDEELAIATDCMEPYQSLSSSNADESLISFRTRSKRPLRDVPLGRLEAELRAPDITPDMYEHGSAPEDREWTQWLQGLMTSDMENEEEGDDEDDPEYNFLAEIDEPDVEDYRNDKAVRITKKEVNDLMDELFDAFQDDLGGQDEDGHDEEEEKEEDEIPAQEPPALPENIQCVEDLMADVLKQRYRTVREQLTALRKRKALLESKGVRIPPPCPKNTSSALTPMILSTAQKLQLQQQIQQHVQLLTQVNMLSSSVKGLETEASTTKQFLLELQMFAQYGELMRAPVEPGFISIFRTCNLQDAISLLEELIQSPRGDATLSNQCFPGSQFPAHLAWLMATRPVFLYPELLPVAQLHSSRVKYSITSAEDCLVVLGHKHMRSTLQPLQMMCRYLLATRNVDCVKSHIQYARQKPCQNVIKTYFLTGKCPPMPLACKRARPCDQRPPVEREQKLMPYWLLKNLKLIHEHVVTFNKSSGDSQLQTADPTEEANECLRAQYSFPPGTRYPPNLPEDLVEALNQAYCKKKKDNPAESTKLPLSAEKLEVLSHLPAILPKSALVASPLLCPHLPQGTNLKRQTASLRPQPNPYLSGYKSVNCPAERPVMVSKLTRMGRGKVTITLPAAVLTPQMISCPGNVVTSNVSPAAPNQGGLIITLPPPQVHNTLICPNPIIKTCLPSVPVNTAHISQHYRTLVKLLSKPTGGLAFPQSVSPKPLNQFFLLPPGCVLTSNSQVAKPCQISKQVLAPKITAVRQNRKPETPDYVNTTGGPLGGPPEISNIQETVIDSVQETEEELGCDGTDVLNEVEEDDERDSRDLFLTLSESSGSPGPSTEDHNDMDIVSDGDAIDEEKLEEQDEGKESCRQIWEEEPGGSKTFHQTMEKLSRVTTETQSENEGSPAGKSSHLSLGEHHDRAGVKTPSVFYNDTLDIDPHRDAKDVAFAQAYLQKVYEVLQVVPEKLEEFLGVLSEFEKDPESHTSLELLRRLRPVLMDWPELLRDFAAFLHPDQAQECGLLAEQQAFERSRRFLRQLECTFGEQSNIYRNVVCFLRDGPSHPAGSKEINHQVKSLFCDHTDLLEEFWVFFKQLHPELQCGSDEDDDTDDVSSVETVQSSEGSPPYQPIGTHSSVEQTAVKHKKKRDEHVQMDSKQRATEVSVCAENISHTANGNKVVLWTREADRVILTTCQQRGARMTTFRAVAGRLGNKTATEVSERYQDLMKLFYKSNKLRHRGPSDTDDHPGTIEDDPD